MAGTAIAMFELFRRGRARLRAQRPNEQFVSDEWIADHVSSDGDGYTDW
jgi:hypothetical protein